MPPIEPVPEKTLLRKMILDDPNSGATAAGGGGSSTFITEAVLTDNRTIDRNADGEIEVKPGSIGEAEIDPALVARTPQIYTMDYILATAGPWPAFSVTPGDMRTALVVDDSDATKNGLWLITINSVLVPIGTRLNVPIMKGTMCVTDGSTTPYGNGYSLWMQVEDGPITVGTTVQLWRRTNGLTVLLGETTSDVASNTLYAGLSLHSSDGTGTFTPEIRTMGLQQYPAFDFSVNKAALAQIAKAPTAVSGAATLLNTVTLARIVGSGIYTITLPPIAGAGAYPAFTPLTIKDETGLLSGFLTVTIAAATGNSFEGPAATVPFNTAFQKATWYNDGVATWFSI